MAQIIFSKIQILESLSPVGFPFAMVRILFGHNIFLIVAEYMLSKIWLFSNYQYILIIAFEVIVLGLYYFSIEYIKTKKPRLMMLCFVGVSKALSLYYSFVTLRALLLFCAGFVIEFLLSLYFYKLFEVYKKKFLFFKFSNFDYFVFAVLVFLLTLGTFNFLFFEKYLGLFAVAFLMLVGMRVFPLEKFYIFSSMLSVGAVCVTLNYFYLIFVVMSSVCLINFRDLNKYCYACFAMLIFGIFVLIFKLFTFIEYFSLIFAVFGFAILPQRFFIKLQVLFEQDATQMILTEVQGNKFGNVKNKLELMSNTFLQMQQDFKMLLIGKIDRNGACEELSKDIVEKCCKECENYKFCFLQNINKKLMIQNMLGLAIEHREITEDSLVNGLQTYCMKKGILINEINQIARLYLSYEKAMKSEDASKLLIASELGNFADIFSNFAKMIENNVKINQKMSKNLKERILNTLIDVKETMIFENDNGIELVCVVSSNENLLKTEMLEIIEKVTKNKMKLKQVKHLEYSGLGVAMFEPVGRFKIEIAVSSKAKEVQNGDSVVVTKLTETKYFVAIADGMGHGESARKISNMVLSLVGSMFEVGLDDELIVESVNKLLIPAGLDNFTTLDACVLDLEKEVCNFIKLGSSVSVIKHKNTSELISAESLPIGVVKNIKPAIISKHLSFDDVIFLASDGVVDSFVSVDEFKNFINDTKIYNLQQHLDNIVFDAGYQSKHLDDMTIIGINLLKN